MRYVINAAIAGTIILAFGAGAFASDMSKAQFRAATKRIEAQDKVARADCVALRGNAKSVCLVDADGRKRIAVAELAAAYHPTQAARQDAKFVRAQADYSVAVQRCQDTAAASRKACEIRAGAVLASANADATEIRKKSTAYRTAKAKFAMARERAREQLADTSAEEAADKPH
jgi:hypothetical protein